MEGSINHAINYGYSIIRSVISKELVAFGLLPTIGVHHHSELNQFNLSDDLIEPYRPFIDAHIISTIATHTELTVAYKQSILTVLQKEVLLGKQSYTILQSIRCMVRSFVANNITLPEFYSDKIKEVLV